jgi:hypothetical protein
LLSATAAVSVLVYDRDVKVPSVAHAKPRLVSRMPPLYSSDEAEASPPLAWTSCLFRCSRNLADASVSQKIIFHTSTGLGERSLAWSDLPPSRALTWLAPLRHHPGHFLRVHLHFLDVHLLPHHWYFVQTIDMVHEAFCTPLGASA